jgi:hypothetical protein
MSGTAWLKGAAPAFDDAALRWLAKLGFPITALPPEPPPTWTIPWLTAQLRRAAYQRRLSGIDTLVLPYLAGDGLLLSGLPGLRTLGIALGSDVIRRRRDWRRHEGWFRRALPRFSALWSVSHGLADELADCGRPPDWVGAVGVEIKDLPPPPDTSPDRARIFSPRRRGAVYRLDWIRAAVSGTADWHLVQADEWPPARMFSEYAHAEVVVSMPLTDGAPATIMEALCMGAHVVASGGVDVRSWLARFGGTYGEPAAPAEVTALIRAGLTAAGGESPADRRHRARLARDAFSRDRLLAPLLSWLEKGEPGRRLVLDGSAGRGVASVTDGTQRMQPSEQLDRGILQDECRPKAL